MKNLFGRSADCSYLVRQAWLIGVNIATIRNSSDLRSKRLVDDGQFGILPFLFDFDYDNEHEREPRPCANPKTLS